MALQFTVTQRNRTAIMYENCYHRRSGNDKNPTEQDENATFTCAMKAHPHCAGRVIVNLRNKQLLHFTPHDHPGNEGWCYHHVARRNLNSEVVANRTVSIPQVFEKQLGLAHDEGKAAFHPGLPSTHRNLRKHRKRHAPFMEAKTVLDVDVTGPHGLTRKGSNFILCDFRQQHPPRSIIVFATDQFIHALATRVSILQMDGTFRTAPKNFFQLFSVHGTIGGKSMPFLYAFMCDKSEESYRAIFRKLREKIVQLIPNFNPELRWTYMMADFENASMNAFRDIFPEVRVVGCLFHHCQAIHRHIASKLHQQALYDEQGAYHSAARRIMSLALLPQNEILQAFEELQEAVPDEASAQCQRLFQYYTQTWLNGFTVETFCVNGLPDRTNNKMEGWHNRISSSLKRKKRGCHETIRDLLKNEQHHFEGLLEQHGAGTVIRPSRRRVYIEVDERLNVLNGEFNNGIRSRLEFLAAASHLIALFGGDDEE